MFFLKWFWVETFYEVGPTFCWLVWEPKTRKICLQWVKSLWRCSDAAFCHAHVNMLRCHDVFCYATKNYVRPSLFGICVQENPMGYRTIILKDTDQNTPSTTTCLGICGSFFTPQSIGVSGPSLSMDQQLCWSLKPKALHPISQCRSPVSIHNKIRFGIWPDRGDEICMLMLMGRVFKQTS